MESKALVAMSLLLLLGSCNSEPNKMVQSGEKAIMGIDVSHHNGAIDWKTIAEKDKMQFVFIKATEGATVVDGLFSNNRAAANKAGLKVGAYHFLTTSSDAESQFNNFRSVVKKEDIDLIPVLDAEKMTKGHPMSETDYVRHVGKWIKLCQNHYGKAPILYCSREHYRKYFKAHFKDCLFWCGDVDARREYVNGESWIIWQKTIQKCHGAKSKLDINVLAPNSNIQDIALNSANEAEGIDVSHHQGTIDWVKVKEQMPNLSFVYVKASEGEDYVDPKFLANAKGASVQGYKIGAFHYFRMTSSPRTQFRNFKRQMDKIHLDLIPMVDVEVSDGKSRRDVQDSLRVLLSLLQKEYGKKPMIYGTMRSYNELCAPEFNDYLLYIGRYGDEKPVVTGPSHYTIWQYSEVGRINGIPKPVDLSRFHDEYSIKDIMIN